MIPLHISVFPFGRMYFLDDGRFGAVFAGIGLGFARYFAGV
jgi:hypothetical protein